MATYKIRLKEREKICQAFVIPMFLPYNTESNHRLLESVADQLGCYVRVNHLKGYGYPLSLLPYHQDNAVNFLLKYMRKNGKRGSVEVLTFPDVVYRVPEFAEVTATLTSGWNNASEICGDSSKLRFYESRGGVRGIIEKRGSEKSRLDNSSNGAIYCRTLDEVGKEIVSYELNLGAVKTPYNATQHIMDGPMRFIIDRIMYRYVRKGILPKCEGPLEILCENLPELEKVASAYLKYCRIGGKCETVEWICVNEKWCSRSSDVEDGAIAWDGNIPKFILNRGPKIFRDLSSKVGVIGGLIVKFEDEPPFKKVVYKVEPSPIVRTLAEYLYYILLKKKDTLLKQILLE
jgi:hypothetical protein